MYQTHKNGEITAVQAYIIIISIMIGSGILGLARLVAEKSQQDAWISVLINSFLISAVVGIIIYTFSHYPQFNFVELCSYLFTKPIGYFIGFVYGIYVILATSSVIRFLSEMIYTWFLPNTPIYVIAFIILITTIYMTAGGLTILARFNEVIFFLLIPFALLVLVGLPELRIINLRPIGGSGIKSIIEGIIPSLYAFSGYEVIMIYYSYISDKHKPIQRNSMLAVLIVGAFYTISVAAQIALFGHQEIMWILYPAINYLGAVEFPLIERMELFFSIFWSFTVLGTAGLQLYSGCIVFQNIFKNKKSNLYIYFMAPVIFIIALVPQNTPQVAEFGDKVGRLNIFFGLLLPSLIFLTSLIKRRFTADEK